MPKAPLQFTIRTIMIWVVVTAIILSIGITVHVTVDTFLKRERSPGLLTPAATVGLELVLTGIAALPFAIAVALGFARMPWDTARHRWIAVRLSATLALAMGVAILRYPIDGTRIARTLNDGSFVTFYHQYRLWPFDHFTPCLEIISANGRARSYPIARNTTYDVLPEIRSDGEQTAIWFIDAPRSQFAYGHAGVWCSLNRVTREFVGAGGPYPAAVGIASGRELR